MIEQTRAANLKDVLDFVPGVMIRPRFGAADESQLSIRGSGLRNNFHLRASTSSSMGSSTDRPMGSATSSPSVRTPSYALGNVRIGFDHKPTKLGVFFEARNIANQSYVVRRRGQRQRAILRAR